MEKQKRLKSQKAFKIIGAAALILLMLPGVYFFGRTNIGGKTLSLALAGVATLGVLLVVSVILIIKNKEKRSRFAKIMIGVMVIGLILVNMGALISPYFVPHHTTTIYNRYFPHSMDYMTALQNLTREKTVWVDADNDYLNLDSEDNTATDYCNRSAVYYASAGIETFNPAPGVLSAEQEAWFKAQEGQYVMIETDYNKHLKHTRSGIAYVYTAMSATDYTDVAFMMGESGDAYWMPMPIFETMMGDMQ